ncbi:endolytic transglycosylase MltG [Streptomyces sp. NPDC017940]|uniref:endolytic transglycosylase MltG n=1 Tax=Streptomyces sp. NPDC017940 TaxID=3365017 RepID=UPI00378A2CD4
MTEYGRGPGSEPWHPEDPLYGDGGWGGQQAAGQSPYGGQGQHHPQDPQHSQQPQQSHPQQSHHDQHQQQAQHQQQQAQQHMQQQQQAPYGDWATGHQPGHDQQQYGQQSHAQAPGAQGAPAAQYGGSGQAQDGGWDSGQHGQVPYGGDPADPYGGQPAAYSEERPDYYATEDAYPPPEPPGRRRRTPEPEPETGWDPGPDQGEHAFFSGDDDDADDSDEPGRGGGRGDRRGRGGKKQRKQRNGCACLVVAVVFAGGLGGVGYFGYQFYQDRFGTAPDFSGDGSGTATVAIDKGSGGYVIGQKLKEAGVVKSVDAFVSAQGKNPDGQKLQAGVYTLKKQMSAASALELMLSPKSRNNLIIPEGKRNIWVYEQIDERLKLQKGATKDIARKQWRNLGLPKWASDNIGSEVKDPLEGFLYPSSYPVAKGQKPEEVLRKMVAEATTRYDAMGVEEQAEQLNLENPLQVVTVASLVQAEGKYKHDFEKVATVVYNRLKPGNTETYGLLDFDSTVNYLKGQSKLAIGSVDQLRQLKDPYNTYKIKGLPPGPIGNPGAVAIKSALNPEKGDWYYFVSVSEDETLFAETNEEQNRNREKYEKNLEEQKGQ